MSQRLTRQDFLKSVAVGCSALIAGCDSGLPPTADDSAVSDRHNDSSPGTCGLAGTLCVDAGEEYIIDGSERYDGVHIADTGSVVLDSDSNLVLMDTTDA